MNSSAWITLAHIRAKQSRKASRADKREALRIKAGCAPRIEAQEESGERFLCDWTERLTARHGAAICFASALIVVLLVGKEVL